MKLYNYTTISDGILKPMFSKSARFAKARSSGVVVIVKQRTQNCMYNHTSGNVIRCWKVKVGCSTIGEGGKWVTTDKARMLITLPHVRTYHKHTRMANDVYEIMLHEWAHIADHQNDDGTLEWSGCNSRGRRPNWKNRPEEIRAERVVQRARGYTGHFDLPDVQEMILNLAIAFEDQITK